MKIPQLKKKPEIKTCHNSSWEDNYSWIHQDDILEVLKDSKKLNPEVKAYLEEENSYTDFYLSDTKKIIFLICFDIFLEDVFAINFNRKKIIPKIISVKMIIFIYLVFFHENTTT